MLCCGSAPNSKSFVVAAPKYKSFVVAAPNNKSFVVAAPNSKSFVVAQHLIVKALLWLSGSDWDQ